VPRLIWGQRIVGRCRQRCRAAGLVVVPKDKRVALDGKHLRDIPRAAVGAPNRPAPDCPHAWFREGRCVIAVHGNRNLQRVGLLGVAGAELVAGIAAR